MTDRIHTLTVRTGNKHGQIEQTHKWFFKIFPDVELVGLTEIDNEGIEKPVKFEKVKKSFERKLKAWFFKKGPAPIEIGNVEEIRLWEITTFNEEEKKQVMRLLLMEEV